MDELHPVTRYALEAVYGDLRGQCCRWEIAACKRHLEDLERAKDPEWPYVFDESRADRIFRHFENLARLDKPGETIRLEDWQKFDEGCIFGWVSKDTGKRRFKKSYRRIARGHAKTTDAAGVCSYGMCGDALYPPGRPELAQYEADPVVLICAVDRGQGKIMWNDVKGIAEKSPAISKRLDIKKSYIRHRTRGGAVEVLSKDIKNKDGARPSILMLEEWHAHQTSAVRDVAASGLGKKWQCLEYVITTAGTDAENKPCYRDDLYYKQILLGEAQNDDIFVMIREIDDEDDPHDMSCWVKANPFFRVPMGDYGRTLLEQVKSEYKAAFDSGDHDKIREFLIKRMDRWQADAENKYFSGCMEKFKEQDASREEMASLLKGTKGYYGFDLGKTTDLSGTAYAVFLKDGRLAFSIHGFMPQDRATQHEHSDRVPYKDWAREGWVTLTPGAVTDNRYAEQWIYEGEEDRGWGAKEIDYDGHNATDMAIRLQESYGEDKVVEIPQTCAGLNQATKRFRELVLQGKTVHDGSPLLYWCLSNAIEVKNNFGDIKLSKKHKDDSQRIDPVAALMNALARAIVEHDSTIDYNAIIKKRGYAVR